MRDQDLIDLACPRIPDEWRRKYLARSVESLPKDVTAAFDRLYKLEREKDQLRADNQSLRRSVRIFFWSAISLQILQLAAALLIMATLK